MQSDLGSGVLIGGRTIPLKTVEVTRLGPTTALATATFNFIIINSPSAPGDTEFTDIRYSVTEMRVPVYRSTKDLDGVDQGYDADGLPAGDMIGCAPFTLTVSGSAGTYYDGRPTAYQFAKTAVQIIVYGISNTPPDVSYVTANKKLNGANNTIGGITFTPGQLRLDGLQAERIVQFDETNGTQSYKYVYAAYYTAAENFVQQAVFNYAADTGEQFEDDGGTLRTYAYSTVNESMHETYESGGNPAALPVPSTP